MIVDDAIEKGWSVGIVDFGNTLAFKGGWTKFRDDNRLREDYNILVFMHKGQLQFYVIILDTITQVARTAYIGKGAVNRGRKADGADVVKIEDDGEADAVGGGVARGRNAGAGNAGNAGGRNAGGGNARREC